MALTINTNLMAANSARSLNSHYNKLATSTQRLSSGLRVNSAADDAAGLAVREMMRSDIATLGQGIRNANDAISLIQTADGALAVIDEKLIRMKELAEQASTGTYNSVQRMIIDSEFQAMADEIDRIANSTDFNGIKLLDGSMGGAHDGSGLNSLGAAKIHFGTGNDSAEDYYYVDIPSMTTTALGLRANDVGIQTLRELGMTLGGGEYGFSSNGRPSGLISMAFIPAGSKNVTLTIDGLAGAEDDIQLFGRDGTHLSGTRITNDPLTNDATWRNNGINDPANVGRFMNPGNGFLPGATYREHPNFNDGNIMATPPVPWNPNTNGATNTYVDGGKKMNITYSGDYDRIDGTPNDGSIVANTKERIFIDEANTDIIVLISGTGVFNIDASWTFMPSPGNIQTQEKAQNMLGRIDRAIEIKDTTRAHLGALQNRLENTVTNLQTQAENLQASESRISDTDVATEMTYFVRQQILTQGAVAMLSQANSLPKMAMNIIGG